MLSVRESMSPWVREFVRGFSNPWAAYAAKNYPFNANNYDVKYVWNLWKCYKKFFQCYLTIFIFRVTTLSTKKTSKIAFPCAKKSYPFTAIGTITTLVTKWTQYSGTSVQIPIVKIWTGLITMRSKPDYVEFVL